MLRCLSPVFLLATLIPASAQTPISAPEPPKYPIQEGYPTAQLQRLNNRAAAMQARLRGGFEAAQSVIRPLQV